MDDIIDIAPPTSREEKIATLRRNGYSPERLAALSDGSPAPEVPNDLSASVPYVNSDSGWLDPNETLNAANVTSVDSMADPVIKWSHAERED